MDESWLSPPSRPLQLIGVQKEASRVQAILSRPVECCLGALYSLSGRRDRQQVQGISGSCDTEVTAAERVTSL